MRSVAVEGTREGKVGGVGRRERWRWEGEVGAGGRREMEMGGGRGRLEVGKGRGWERLIKNP